MIHTLKCPSCSGPLDYDDASGGSTCVCPFCANKVVVPESLRQPRESQDATFRMGRPHRGGNRPVLAAVVVVSLFLLVGGILFAAGAFAIKSTVDGARPVVADRQPPRPFVPPLPPRPPGKAPYPGILLEFGGEGIGPGLFKDARNVAVDGEGNIYAADYTGGRVQVFDPSGKFLTQWMVDARMPLRGLAADRKGTVYVVQSGKIMRYDGKTGEPRGKLAYAGGDGFDDVFVTADGGLVAVYDRNADDIVRFDSAGRVTKVIKGAFSNHSDQRELNMRAVADGLGNVYALGSFNNKVLKFTADGRFVNQFGGDGDEPGTFRAAHAIAVDGQGRVYVTDFKGIQVFDANGRYIETFNPSPMSFGLLFNDRNELFIAARTKVLKVTPPSKGQKAE
ncbi:MAG TPA: NHL repeat-containing protein [Pyrinomonadaceae bacterium]|nr:NHL repeat-containing protein [Pyrinomonadaceae bacterium]